MHNQKEDILTDFRDIFFIKPGLNIRLPFQ